MKEEEKDGIVYRTNGKCPWSSVTRVCRHDGERKTCEVMT